MPGGMADPVEKQSSATSPNSPSRADGRRLTMRVAVIAAMPIELRPLVRALGLQPSGDDYVGTLNGHEIIAAKMGVGMTGATATTERLLRSGDVDRVVVIGICGGLDASIPIRSVPLPEGVLPS